MIVLDTHVLIWAAGEERKLGRKTRALIDAAWPDGQVAVSAITFWELGLLAERKRFRPDVGVPQWRKELLDAGLTELPLDGEIAIRALDLQGLPEDPADRFITATALLHDASLVTADRKILGWRHSLRRLDAAT